MRLKSTFYLYRWYQFIAIIKCIEKYGQQCDFFKRKKNNYAKWKYVWQYLTFGSVCYIFNIYDQVGYRLKENLKQCCCSHHRCHTILLCPKLLLLKIIQPCFFIFIWVSSLHFVMYLRLIKMHMQSDGRQAWEHLQDSRPRITPGAGEPVMY